MIDLMRAHNAGCVFYVSDNNVILTEECIPPPCIARAQCTSTGEAYDLNRFRTAYKMICAAPNLCELVIAGLGHSTAWSVLKAQLALSPCCRCSSRSASDTPSLTGREGSRVATPSHSPAAPRWVAWTLRSHGQVLDLPAAYRLPLALAVHLPRSFFRLRIAMQKGTPLGQVRRYSWKATAGRSEASSPPTLDHQAHSEPSREKTTTVHGPSADCWQSCAAFGGTWHSRIRP